MPDFPSTTDTPPMESRIIPRILPEDFNVPNKETLDLIMNFEESQGRFNRRREFETSAQPKCNGEALQLNLECEGCHVGFPKLDLCVRFSREDSLRDESEFKCKIDCGPGFKIADGFNKVKCTKDKWKHLKKDVKEKTCVRV
ncbi:Oidioi.mRNA.OKI2018_I69.PAR.g12207.t1.cds [Oikopleura dioica]|uniref:Oidioi.mRNA.OKI2018_I69.PAR.g12207.t1.cds n=1 Tax=Oikopleura dioica TaxID=34765 RepID=A0ABN7RZK3_OIKDI|nr:Oidioi.mRNA.OKI2018_I69.PAR.g12207.t1.cds [Oikopleura dioica]